MSVQLPDGSLLLSALDGLARQLLATNAQVAFRLSLTGHTLRLDYQSLLAEFEVLALSGIESESGGKRQRVRKMMDPNSPKPPDHRTRGGRPRDANTGRDVPSIMIWRRRL